jgi:hypothetical protein
MLVVNVRSLNLVLRGFKQVDGLKRHQINELNEPGLHTWDSEAKVAGTRTVLECFIADSAFRSI